jgi:hypothetical protein
MRGSSIVHSISKPRTGARVYAHQDYEENNETDEDEIGHEPLLWRYCSDIIGDSVSRIHVESEART